jgi:hypothetical protein
VSVDAQRRALDAAVLVWMREAEWHHDETRFAALARELFAFQFEHCAAYRGLCTRRGATPDQIESWREIPSVPTGAFKELTLTSFPRGETCHVFRTSGTSSSARGALHLDTLELYEASLLPAFRRHLLPDLPHGERVRIEVLAPSAEEAPDSSLSHMFAVAIAALGSAASRHAVEHGSLDAEALYARLARDAARGETILLCGTAFAFVHFLEYLEERGHALELPPGTRIMETGGFKGRARELPRQTLYAELEARLGVPPGRIVNQYGMTELGSQFYDSVLVAPKQSRRKLAPPWVRVRIVDAESGRDVAHGEVGTISIVDLANTGSVCAIQTADLGRAIGDGFEVLGREPDAEARGCSIAADALLVGAVP